MNMKIGEKIKKLRKEQDVTQEKLGEYLGISFQAISKWENGTALPDITLVPALARFFRVTTDELLGMDPEIEDEKVKEYQKEYDRLNNIGDTKGKIVLMRRALEEYPRNYQFMINLAYSLMMYNATEEQNRERKEKGYDDEAVRLCERILEDCTEDDIRHSAVQILCFNYPKLGRTEEAKKLAEKMPAMAVCMEMLFEHILTGSEKIEQTQGNILLHIDNAATSLVALIYNDYMGKELTPDQKIKFIEAANKLYETIMPDGNYFFYNCRLTWNYHMLARLWCELGDKYRAVECLEATARCAESYDSLPETAEYTSLFLNRRKHNNAHTMKNFVGTECGMLYDRMQQPVFDSIRDMPEFNAILEGLSKQQIETIT